MFSQENHPFVSIPIKKFALYTAQCRWENFPQRTNLSIAFNRPSNLNRALNDLVIKVLWRSENLERMTFESDQQIKVYKKYPTIAMKYQLNGQSIKKLQISFNNTDEFFQCVECFNLWNIPLTETKRSDNRSTNTTIAQYQKMPSYSQSNGFSSSFDELKSKPQEYVRPNFQEPLQLVSNFRPNDHDSPGHSFIPSGQLLNNNHNHISPPYTFGSTLNRTIQRKFFSTLDTPLLSKSDSNNLNGSNLLRNGSFVYPMRQGNKLSLSNILNEDSDNQFLNYQPNQLVGSNNIDLDTLNNRPLEERTPTFTPNTSLIAIEKDPSAIDTLNCVYDIKSVEADLIDTDAQLERETDEIMKNLEIYVRKRLQDQKFIELVRITKISLLSSK